MDSEMISSLRTMIPTTRTVQCAFGGAKDSGTPSSSTGTVASSRVDPTLTWAASA